MIAKGPRDDRGPFVLVACCTRRVRRAIGLHLVVARSEATKQSRLSPPKTTVTCTDARTAGAARARLCPPCAARLFDLPRRVVRNIHRKIVAGAGQRRHRYAGKWLTS